MKPLVVLLAVFLAALMIIKVLYGGYNFAVSGRISLSAMLIFSAVGHFAFNKGMSLMLPDFVPFKPVLIFLTGVIEILLAIGLFFSAFKSLTGYFIIIFLLMILPSNIYASLKHVDYEKATFDGHGIHYLWFRIPLQLLFILWTYFFSIKN